MDSVALTTALLALKEGRTLLYPTDTIWGVGCDATSADAVERIYAIKERDHKKPMLVLATEGMLLPTVPDAVRRMLLYDGRPTTVVVPAEWFTMRLAANLPAKDGTVGVRIPRMEFCKLLIDAFGSPIVSTSANLSGDPSPKEYGDISPVLKARVDCCLEDDPSYPRGDGRGSRIMKVLEDGTVLLLRR